jgi:molybdopterin synthase sulfur carrier subunit
MTPLIIREELTLESKALGQELSEPQVLVAVNKMIVKWDHIICDGDEIAFLPPVTGG